MLRHVRTVYYVSGKTKTRTTLSGLKKHLEKHLYEALENVVFNLFNEIYTSVLTQLLLSAVRTTKTYLHFTQKHGWNYIYTGSLATSWKMERAKSLKVINKAGEQLVVSAEATISSDHPAASILETGGVISPKRGKYLAVPLSRTPFPINYIHRVPISFWQNKIGYVKIGGLAIPVLALKEAVRIPAYRYLSKILEDFERNLKL